MLLCLENARVGQPAGGGHCIFQQPPCRFRLPCEQPILGHPSEHVRPAELGPEPFVLCQSGVEPLLGAHVVADPRLDSTQVGAAVGNPEFEAGTAPHAQGFGHRLPGGLEEPPIGLDLTEIVGDRPSREDVPGLDSSVPALLPQLAGHVEVAAQKCGVAEVVENLGLADEIVQVSVDVQSLAAVLPAFIVEQIGVDGFEDEIRMGQLARVIDRFGQLDGAPAPFGAADVVSLAMQQPGERHHCLHP